MTRRHEDEESRLDLGTEDRRFFEALAETYQPPPLTPARRAAMRRGVDDRLAWWRPRALAPAVATLAAAAVAAWLVFVASSPPPSLIDEADPIAWEETLFLAGDLAELTPDAEYEFLPDDYEAIATYLLEL